MDSVNDTPLPTSQEGRSNGDNSPGSTPSKQGNKTMLPSTFQPSINSVILGKGNVPKNAPGNKQLRHIVSNHVTEYSSIECRRGRAMIVRSIVEHVRELCRPFGGGAFVKYEQGKWREVNHTATREKVTSVFRDFLHDQYKSSTKNKVAKRRARKEISRHEDMMQLASIPVVSATNRSTTSTAVIARQEPSSYHHRPPQENGNDAIEFGTARVFPHFNNLMMNEHVTATRASSTAQANTTEVIQQHQQHMWLQQQQQLHQQQMRLQQQQQQQLRLHQQQQQQRQNDSPTVHASFDDLLARTTNLGDDDDCSTLVSNSNPLTEGPFFQTYQTPFSHQQDNRQQKLPVLGYDHHGIGSTTTIDKNRRILVNPHPTRTKTTTRSEDTKAFENACFGSPMNTSGDAGRNSNKTSLSQPSAPSSLHAELCRRERQDSRTWFDWNDVAFSVDDSNNDDELYMSSVNLEVFEV